MDKKPIILLLICLCSVQLFTQKILILYDGTPEKSEAFLSAQFTRNLLFHFPSYETRILPISQYQTLTSNSDDCIFILCDEDRTVIPAHLIKDLHTREGAIVWMDMHIDKLLKDSTAWNFSYADTIEKSNCRILYKQGWFSKEDSNLNIIKIHDSGSVHIFAQVTDPDGNKYPYIIKNKNLWYIADSPFSYANEGGRFLIFADLLHDILGEYHVASHQAMVRIEDVNPRSSATDIINITDYLDSQGIPFHISLIPIFREPNTKEDTLLSDNPKLIEAIQYAVSKGATIIMHGITHQNQGVSGVDYEFWDPVRGKPVRHESDEWRLHRI